MGLLMSAKTNGDFVTAKTRLQTSKIKSQMIKCAEPEGQEGLIS